MGIGKTDNWDRMIAWIKEKDRHFKGKKERIDHDLIAYGVSRDGTTLESIAKKKKRE